MQVTIATGYDVDYYLDQVGADYYLSAAGEPPGIWAGSAAPGLGLTGEVDPDVMRALYHHDTAPDGTPLVAQRGPKYQAKRTYKQVQEAIDKRIRDELGELAPHMPDQVRKIRSVVKQPELLSPVNQNLGVKHLPGSHRRLSRAVNHVAAWRDVAVRGCGTGMKRGTLPAGNMPLTWARSEGLEPPTF